MRKTKLLFVVHVKDAFRPRKHILGNSIVTINGEAVKSLKHRPGFFPVVNMRAGQYSVAVSNALYCDQIREIETSELNPLSPAVEMALEPNLFYAFPRGATLLRGKVMARSGPAVMDAVVNVNEIDKAFITDKRGEFVFYFKRLEEEEEPVSVVVSKPGFMQKEVNVNIVRGDVNLLEFTLEPE